MELTKGKVFFAAGPFHPDASISVAQETTFINGFFG